MKKLRKTSEEREIDEMIKFEIESGNPFSEYASYRSYAASGSKKKKSPGVKKDKEQGA